MRKGKVGCRPLENVIEGSNKLIRLLSLNENFVDLAYVSHRKKIDRQGWQTHACSHVEWHQFS